MLSLNTQYALGLDIGQSTVKAVRLGLQGKRVRFTGKRVLDCRAEGLLGADELRAHLPGWLGAAGWRQQELTVGIPQYLATTQITEFPPANEDGLLGMVTHEAQQLAGLSEERFIHGHAVLKTGVSGKVPVLIGICRHSAVNERAETLLQDGLCPAGFGVSGIALANAYFHLYPEAAADAAPQLLLDLGTESSTVIVVAAGRLLYLGTLSFGAQRYTQALAKHLNQSEAEAEQAKLQARLNLSDTSSPVYRTTRVLEAELRSVLDHWRSTEQEEILKRGFGRIALSGGGARLPGLAAYFAQAFTCAAEVIGVPVEGETERDPGTLIAYGLALQGLGQAAIPLSMTPAEVAGQACRRRNFGYLVAAAAILTVTLVFFSLWTYQRLLGKEKQLTAYMQELDQCNQIVPQLEDIREETLLREKMLLPLVAKANRNRHFLQALERLSEVKGPEDWFVYFADIETYRGVMGKWGEGMTAQGLGGDTKSALASPLLGGGDIVPASRPAPDVLNRVLANDVQPLQGFIIGGYTQVLKEGPKEGQPYKRIRGIVDDLNKHDAGVPAASGTPRNTPTLDVDLLPETERAGHEDLFMAWADQFNTNLKANRDGPRYKSFMLRVPLRSLDIILSPPKK